MHLTDDDIRAFQEAWKTDWGEEISPEFARIRFQEVLEVLMQLAGPLPSEKDQGSSESSNP